MSGLLLRCIRIVLMQRLMQWKVRRCRASCIRHWNGCQMHFTGRGRPAILVAMRAGPSGNSL